MSWERVTEIGRRMPFERLRAREQGASWATIVRNREVHSHALIWPACPLLASPPDVCHSPGCCPPIIISCATARIHLAFAECTALYRAARKVRRQKAARKANQQGRDTSEPKRPCGMAAGWYFLLTALPWVLQAHCSEAVSDLIFGGCRVCSLLEPTTRSTWLRSCWWSWYAACGWWWWYLFLRHNSKIAMLFTRARYEHGSSVQYSY